jgi:NADP-dependent 3-hydroxy acid dehydrogenase YdfG
MNLHDAGLCPPKPPDSRSSARVRTLRTVLIAGASGGIGRAVALAAAYAGLRPALVGRDRDKLEATRDALGVAAEDAPILLCDVTDRVEVASMVEAALGALGSIDVLVCASGMNVPKRSLRAIDPSDWDRVIGANLGGAFNLIHAVLPSMRSRGDGLIVQMSSLAGVRASSVTGAAYAASKFAQTALGVVVGREERGRGIRSTVLHLGEVDTPLLDVRAARPGGGESVRREGILRPEDVARAVLFLVELPPRAHVAELVLKPTIDDFA